jgi:hypothetical protein
LSPGPDEIGFSGPLYLGTSEIKSVPIESLAPRGWHLATGRTVRKRELDFISEVPKYREPEKRAGRMQDAPKRPVDRRGADTTASEDNVVVGESKQSTLLAIETSLTAITFQATYYRV